jgi:hypothetical protein
MSEGPELSPVAPEMTHARAAGLAFRWALGGVVLSFLPFWRLGSLAHIQAEIILTHYPPVQSLELPVTSCLRHFGLTAA